MNLFNKVPFLRLLLPFAGGILLQIQWQILPATLWLLVILLALYSAFHFIVKLHYWFKIFALLVADVFMLFLGANITTQSNLHNSSNHFSNLAQCDSVVKAIVVVSDLPEEKEKFIKTVLSFKEVKTNSVYKNCHGNIIAYFRKDILQEPLKAGDTYLMRLKLMVPDVPKNPYEFDYKNYLENKQIFYTAFLEKNSFIKLNVKNTLSPVILWGLNAKQYIVEHLKNNGLDKDASAICSALLTGYDADVEQNVTDAFTHSGTLHVLSVSGLHTGLIYLLLNFLLGLADKHNKYRLVRFIVVSTVLWLFALITGFSAPVLRAVIMFNLFGLGKIYFRNDFRNQLNILLVSAFVLLVYNPFYITDVGFILSYTALGGIIYFQPRLSAPWTSQHPVLNAVWQSLSASVAATIGTLPITLYYFKQFSFWFFLGNLVVVPLSFVLLLLALVAVFKGGIIVWMINKLVAFLIYFMSQFNTRGAGYIDCLDFSFLDAVFLSLLIIAISMAFSNKSYAWFASAFVILISWQFLSLYGSFQQKQQQLFATYQLKKKAVYLVKNKTHVQLSPSQKKDYIFHVQPHIIRFNYADTTEKPFNYVAFKEQQILILNSPKNIPNVDLTKVTLLVLSNNFKLSETILQQCHSLKMVVADGSNNKYTCEQAEQLCCKFELEFYNTQSKGAFIKLLQ